HRRGSRAFAHVGQLFHALEMTCDRDSRQNSEHSFSVVVQGCPVAVLAFCSLQVAGSAVDLPKLSRLVHCFNFSSLSPKRSYHFESLGLTPSSMIHESSNLLYSHPARKKMGLGERNSCRAQSALTLHVEVMTTVVGISNFTGHVFQSISVLNKKAAAYC